MRKNKELSIRRQEHIKNRIGEYVNSGHKVETAVYMLSEELFLSERTIWRELVKSTDTTANKGEETL